MGKRRLKIGFLVVLLLLNNVCSSQEREYLLKAAYIEKIVNFIEWPDSSIHGNFIIGVYGNKMFATILNDFFRSDSGVNGTKIKVQEVQTIEGIQKCQVLVIDAGTDDLTGILKNIETHPVLTIADYPGYANRGVMVNFYIDANKIKFELNPNEMKKANLSVNYMLYKVAKIVKTTF